jgi:hypothetical protein
MSCRFSITSFPYLVFVICAAGVFGPATARASVRVPLRASEGLLPASAVDPLLVGETSHVVVIEYEAWFGPNAVTFQGSAAMPLLQSADMQPVGGGYDSADSAVIQQHVEWMEYMGVDAASIDLSNNISCIFNSQWFVSTYLENFNGCPTWRTSYQNIRDNTGNLYPAWSGLGTSLKLIPLLGGIDQNALYLDSDGETAFEKEIEYFDAFMTEYPGLNVIYQGKPLMLIYLGAAQDPNQSDNPLWFQIKTLLSNRPELQSKYTFKMVAGYLESQPSLWVTPDDPDGPEEISPQYGFWSVGDRLNTSCTDPLCPYYPTYNEVVSDSGFRVENMTAAIATEGQNGWGCPNANSSPYCSDDSLRFGEDQSYATLESFMAYARQLDPIFLIIDQFNEFMSPDEGWDANTNDDIEPANLWGSGAIDAVKQEIEKYRNH